MRILDMFRKQFKQRSELVLDSAASSHWAQQLVDYLGVDTEFKTFSETTQALSEQIEDELKKLTSEDMLAAIPDRARTMNALHGSEYATQVRKLLKTAHFSDLFAVEEQQAAYFEANSVFKDQTAKNLSVLKEFLHDELKVITSALQSLEDAIINFTKLLEDRKFAFVRKVQDTHRKLQEHDARLEKYQKLQVSLAADLKRTQEKRVKLEGDITAQRALIRNTESLQALEKSQKVDEELHKLAAQYVSLAQDLKNIYKKNYTLSLTPKIKHVIEELPKDPLQFLSANAENVKAAFEDIITQFEEERPGNTRGVIERLNRLAQAAEADGRKIATSFPDQRALKREVMKDIAALNIYDKQQFLLRAKAEEEAINTKLEYLAAELDPNKRLSMEREMKDAAIALGAIIKDDHVAPTAPVETEPVAETEDTPAIPEKTENPEEKKQEKKKKAPKEELENESAEDIEPEHEK